MFEKIGQKLDRLAGLQSDASNNNMPTQQPYPAAPQQYTQQQPMNASQPPPYGYPQQPQYSQQHQQQPQAYPPQGIPQQQPPRFRITKDHILNLQTNTPILQISHQSKTTTLTRPDGTVVGTFTFHSMSTFDIDYTLGAQTSKLKDLSAITGVSGWKFKPISALGGALGRGSGENWKWKMKDDGVSWVLKDGGGAVVAGVKDGVVSFERGVGMGECDEVLVTAVGMVEKTAKEEKETIQVLKIVGHMAGA